MRLWKSGHFIQQSMHGVWNLTVYVHSKLSTGTIAYNSTVIGECFRETMLKNPTLVILAYIENIMALYLLR